MMKLSGSHESTYNDSSMSESPSDSDTNLVSSSSSLPKFVTALIVSNMGSFCEKVMNINSICLKDDWIQAF